MTTRIFKPAYIEEAKQYIHGVLYVDVETIAQAVRETAHTIDSLKKGWHVSSIKEDADGNLVIEVQKETSKKPKEPSSDD